MVSTRPLISKSSSPFINTLVTVLSETITIGITVTYMFHSFFSSLVTSRYLSLISLSFSFTPWSAGAEKSTTQQVLFLLLTITRSGRLAEITWSVCISKSQSSLWVSLSRTDSELCIDLLLVRSSLIFLHNSQWITYPTHSCLVLYSFWVSLLHSLIIWLIVLSLSPHNIHVLFYCVLSIFALI